MKVGSAVHGTTETSRANVSTLEEPAQSGGEKGGNGSESRGTRCANAVHAIRSRLNGPIPAETRRTPNEL